jgi:hypothetical protein
LRSDHVPSNGTIVNELGKNVHGRGRDPKLRYYPDISVSSPRSELRTWIFLGAGLDVMDIPSPPRLPYNKPFDIFLWGYVKDIVYKTPVTSLGELKLKIVTTIENYAANAGEHLKGN